MLYKAGIPRKVGMYLQVNGKTSGEGLESTNANIKTDNQSLYVYNYLHISGCYTCNIGLYSNINREETGI